MPLIKPIAKPVAARQPKTHSAHGHQWQDNYAWLRAENWQEVISEPSSLAAPISQYLQAENDYFEQATRELKPLQQELVAEMRARIKEKDDSIPLQYKQYLYSERYSDGCEHEVYIRTDLNDDNEEILFDVNIEASKTDYFDLGQFTVSPDNKKMLWTSDTSGAEFYQLKLQTIANGKCEPYIIEGVDSVCWADSSTLFYSRLDKHHRPLQVYKHVVGTDPKNDVLVYTETDTRFSVYVETSMSEEYVFICSGVSDMDEVWFIPVNNLDTPPQLIQTRTPLLEYSVDHQGDRFIIETNAGDATDFKLVETPVTSPSLEHWYDLVPHQKGCLIEDFFVLQDWIVWTEMRNALPQLAFMDKAGNISRVHFFEEAYSFDAYSGFEFKADTISVEYSTPAMPTQTFEYSLKTQQRTLLKQETIPSGHNPDDYIVSRIQVPSHDGAIVPVTLLYHKNTAIDGTAPALLYGYGSYGASCYAEFSRNRLSLVKRGFVYATAHVRGGEENGRTWYFDATKEKKPNSFYDFIAVAEALSDKHYCAADKLVSMGGSAGGLLVAASMNLRPDLFAGVIADVPFVDVLNTILDDTLPGTPAEWAQWGNPIESAEAFEWIKHYCPYNNVAKTDYPALYITAGVSDPRVTYWEPAKWAAQIRYKRTNDNLLLLNTNLLSGHFGKSGRFAELEDSANSYVFALAVTGLA